MVTRKECKRKNSTFLMFNLPDEKLARTQDSQALQNSDEKQYCQYWMLRLVVINQIARKQRLLVKTLYAYVR